MVHPLSPVSFGSLLSIEAQYSLLKGYEDLLRTALLKGRPSLTHSLVRVLTPKRRIVSLRAIDVG